MGLDGGCKLRLGLDRTPGEHRFGNGARDDISPEVARRQRARNRGEPAAMAADQRRKLANSRGQQGFNSFTQALCQNRRSAAGSDRDHHLAAIDDGGKNEGRQIRTVDDIDGNALAPRARGDLTIEQLASGRNDGDDVAQVRLEGIPEADFKLPLPRRRRQLFRNVDVAGEPADMCAGRPQQAQLGERRLARADKDKDACRGIEKQRKEPHLTISETGNS